MLPRLRIHPGHGVGPFVVGLSRAELRSAAGPPDSLERGTVVGDGYEDWTFDGGNVEVRFNDEDGDRAGWIVVSDPDAEIAGLRVIGLDEATFLAVVSRAGIAPLVVADDFGDGVRDYEWPATNLSFWVSGGIVESITVMPLYDASGEVPLWPPDAGIDGATR